MAEVNKKLQIQYDYSTIKQEDGKQVEQELEEYMNKVPKFGVRHVQVALYFVLGFVAFMSRVSLSIAIVAMTDPSVSSNPNIVTYPEWKSRNIILSAFFWGYVLPQLFAAWVAKKYGAKWFLVGALFIQSVLSILTPVTAAQFGEKGMMVSRAVEGFCQGFIIPSTTHLLSQWVPPQERSRYGSVIFTSGKLGTLVSTLATGFIAASSYGWPWVFRAIGFLEIVWCILMATFGYSSPKDHPKISEVETLYIEESLGHSDSQYNRTPWKAIITSVPVWALLTAQTGQTYAFWTLMTQMPSYMNYVMKLDMKDNGLWTAMPYLAMFTLSYVFGFISDTLINKGILSRGAARKIFNSIGFFIPGIALVALGYTNADQHIRAIVLSIIAIGVSAACYSGFAVNHMDLSPNHAGMIMGLLNAIAQSTGAIAPVVVQLLDINPTDPVQWRSVFFIAAGTYFISAVIFNLFGSGKVQDWNTETKKI